MCSSDLKLRKNLYFFISVFIFLALLIIWLIYWNKTYKLRQRILNDNYNRLLDELEESNINANKSEKQLEEVLSDTNSRTHLTAITPNIFRTDGETKFRERFNQLYTTFILKLREKIPNRSRNEEILCMLITLGQNTNQIVDILCIEKGSVNMARYRLRSKMKLNKDDSLDDYLKEITST